MEWIRSRLEQIEDLPTLPVIIERFSRAARGNNWEVSEVAGIIRRDPSISTNLLRASNSSLYRKASAAPIDTIDGALVHLGITVVRHIVYSTSIIKAFKPLHSDAFPLRELWIHSLGTSMVANLLLPRLPQNIRQEIDPGRLNLAALVHDIGKIILLRFFPDEFGSAIHHARKHGVPLNKAELATIGANHAEVGGWLANRWVRSTEFHGAIRWHHSPLEAEEEAVRMACLVHLADFLTNREKVGNSGNNVLPEFVPDALAKIGFKEADLEKVAEEISERDLNDNLALYFAE